MSSAVGYFKTRKRKPVICAAGGDTVSFQADAARPGAVVEAEPVAQKDRNQMDDLIDEPRLNALPRDAAAGDDEVLPARGL
ncbi:MAG TPA: hypothetical protein VEQ37_05400 [Actinomycetota bacterium]|nr:hypothetical protein [Actinomycetota bacterium]